MALAGENTLMGLIGVADNFGEPMPQINRRETILGLCITFMVTLGSWAHGGDLGLTLAIADTVVALCRVQVVCEILRDQVSWVGRSVRSLVLGTSSHSSQTLPAQ